jgi:hypothetical protein
MPCSVAARIGTVVEGAAEREKGSMQTIVDSFRRYCRIIAMAEQRLRCGDTEAAVALAQIAARLAFPAAVGLFASPQLERLLVRIGQSLPTPRASCGRASMDGRQRILHVLTYARPVGGDTRFVWRWIKEDQANVHCVAVTTQADVSDIYEIPKELAQSVARSGGFLHVLQASTARPLEQALELRGLCREMDSVVLHLFPYDVIPVLALAAGCSMAKTLFVDHSDHTFWIGASVAHAIIHVRAQPPGFLQGRRGLRARQEALLPIPLAHMSSAMTPVQAKEALGLAREQIVLLTIASPFKYSAPGRPGLLDLVVPVLRELPQAVLLAVGPEPTGAWQEANRRTDGRVVALGARYENGLLYTAADIYLDSVPFSSSTSLLEAGSQGVPVLCLAPPEEALWPLGPGAPGLEGTMELAADVPGYRRLLRRLIVDDDYRTQSGQRVRAQILARHTGAGWQAAIREVYTQLARCGERGCLRDDGDVFVADALTAALANLYAQTEGPQFMRQLLWRFLRGLPYLKRIAIVWELHRQGCNLSIFNLLPSSWNVMARRLLHLARWVQARLSRRFAVRRNQTYPSTPSGWNDRRTTL